MDREQKYYVAQIVIFILLYIAYDAYSDYKAKEEKEKAFLYPPAMPALTVKTYQNAQFNCKEHSEWASQEVLKGNLPEVLRVLDAYTLGYTDDRELVHAKERLKKDPNDEVGKFMAATYHFSENRRLCYMDLKNKYGRMAASED